MSQRLSSFCLDVDRVRHDFGNLFANTAAWCLLCTYADPLILHLHKGRVGRVDDSLKYASYPSKYIYKSCCYL